MVQQNSLSTTFWVIVGTATISAGYYFFLQIRKQAKSKSRKDIVVIGSNEEAIESRHQGNVLFKADKFDEAIVFYTKAVNLSTDCIEKSLAYANRAAAFLAIDKVEDALHDLNDALKLNPKFVKALDRRSRILQKLGQLNAALEDAVSTALLDDFKSNKFMSQIEEILKVMGEKEARSLFSNRKHQISCDWITKQFFRTFPKEFQKFTSIPQANVHAKFIIDKINAAEFDELYEYLSSNDDIDQLDYIHLNCRGSFHFLAGELDAAEASMKLAMNACPDSVEARIKQALVYLEQGRYNDMSALMDQALVLDNANPSIYYHRGEICALSNNIEAAISDFSHVIKLDPNFLDAYMHLSRAYITINMPTQAKEYIKAGLERFPDNPELLHTLGECEALNGNYSDALNLFNKVESLAPDFPHVQLSSALIRSTIPGVAEDRLEKDLVNILTKFPRFAAAHLQLAGYLIDQGRIDAAIQHYESAAQNSRSFQEVVSICTLKAISIARFNVSCRFPDLKGKLRFQ